MHNGGTKRIISIGKGTAKTINYEAAEFSYGRGAIIVID